MKTKSVDAAIEDLNVNGRAIQRLWWENDKLLFSLCGPGVVDVYAKTSPKLIGRKVFTGADDEPRMAKHENLIPLTPQGATAGGLAWVASLSSADRNKPIRPWTYNSFTNDSRRPGYGARCGFQVYRPAEAGKAVCDGVWGGIKTRLLDLRATMHFETRPGESFTRVVLSAPGPLYSRHNPVAPKMQSFRYGCGIARLPGEANVRRGPNYLALYAEPAQGKAKKIGLAVIYDQQKYKAYAESAADGGSRLIYFHYEPIKRPIVRLWLAAGWDGDKTATSAGQWEKRVKILAKQFEAEMQSRR